MLCPECGGSHSTDFPRCPWCGAAVTAHLDERLKLDDVEAEQSFITPLFRFPPLTLLILLINVGVFFLLERWGGSEDNLTLLIFGAKFRAAIANDGYWRLLTANFLHIGFWHLLGNGVTLLQLGMICENIYGRVRFVLLYLVCGASGFALSAYFSETLSAGASASLAGLMGATLVFGWRHPKGIPPRIRRHLTWYLVPWVVLMLGFGFFYGRVDNLAHIGGLVSGLVLGLFLGNRILGARASRWSHLWLTLAGMGSLLFCVYSIWNAYFHIVPELEMRFAGGGSDLVGESEVLSRYLDDSPCTGLYHYLRAETRRKLGQMAAAEEDYRRALACGYDLPVVKNALSWLIISEGLEGRSRLNEAIRLVREALRVERSPAYQNTLGWALYLRGDTVAAIRQLESAYHRHLEDDPGSAALDLYMLSLAYRKKGDEGAARERLEAAQALDAGLQEKDADIERFRAEVERVFPDQSP